ncbi:major facilitator superfamily domain-containing protein 9 isoform X3 [Python bivittatus]|nr:major facilitator superfamily domain-containing protein 9 isoform X3 [Python bivittatus]XP_025029198.1 major facilitator superfamily domain-containing protein 9 isoform X3 [Python bivittatus]XP_025029201.1 major facilitator superfamily domain-containing protein 9 isoform X3 [Python bivittatus]
MIVPLLNLHVKSLGASSTIAGVVGSLYGILQLFSSTLVGSWSDLVGRPHCLLVCILFSALGYFVLSISTSVFLFAIARTFVGIFKHTHSISKVLISDLVPKKERLLVIGYFNAISNFGFILGPVVGGYLTELESGFYLTAFICASIFVLNAGVFWLMLRCGKKRHSSEWTLINKARSVLSAEVNHSLQTTTSAHEAMPSSSHTNSSCIQVMSVLKRLGSVASSNLWDVFLVRLLMSVAVMLYHSNFVLALEERFGMKPRFTGYLISYSSTLGVAAGFLLGPITKCYRHNTYAMLLHSTLLTCLFMFLYSVSESLWTVILSCTFLAFSTTVGRTCVTELELTLGGDQASGMLIGVGQSVSAVGRIISPLLSGVVQEYSPCGPPILGSLLGLSAVLIMVFNKSRYSVTRTMKFKSM